MCSPQSSSLGRSQKGVLGLLVMSAGLVCIIVIGVLAVDFAHVGAVASELQNATDAAALAGARSIDIDDLLAEPDALSVAAQNWADGRSVSNDSRDTNVSVSVTPSNRERPGFVSVSATMSIHHILAPVLGRYTDTVSASSLAGPSGTINMLGSDRAFPLAVSIDALPDGNGQGDTVSALNRNRLTDVITLYVDVQAVKNAAFTSFDQDSTDYDYLRNSLDRALGLATNKTASIPPVKIGDKLRLCDGIVSQHHLCGADQYAALMSKPYIVLPVVKGYPQKCTEACVVGFVGAKILDATVDWDRRVVRAVRIRLIKNIPKTRSGELPITGEQDDDLALNNLSPGAVKLLPRDVVPAADVSASKAALVAGPAVRKPSVPGGPAGQGTGLDRGDGKTAETMQSGELKEISPPASPMLSAQIGLIHNSGFEPQLLKRELERLTKRAVRTETEFHGSEPSRAVASAAGSQLGLPKMSLPIPEFKAGPATRRAIENAAPEPNSESIFQTVLNPTDAVTSGTAKPLSVTWEIVTFLWVAAGIGLVSRHRRSNSSPRTGFKDAVPWRDGSRAPVDPGYATMISRLARIRTTLESRPECAASPTTSIFGRFRPTSNPWAHTRLSRIRAMRYWHLRTGPRSGRVAVRQSESRMDIRRLRMMTDPLSASPEAVPGDARDQRVWP